MIKKKRIIILFALIAICMIVYIVNGRQKEMLIQEELLNPTEIEYIEITGPSNELHTKITDTDNIQRISLLLQQLNGPVELEYLPSDEPLVAFSIAIKGHYPSGTILVYEDEIFFGQGRNVSKELVNELVVTIENSF